MVKAKPETCTWRLRLCGASRLQAIGRVWRCTVTPMPYQTISSRCANPSKASERRLRPVVARAMHAAIAQSSDSQRQAC